MMAATEFEIKIAEVKEWFEGFTPSNEMEECFKSDVKEALENVTQDFMVRNGGDSIKLDPSKTWESHIKELKSGGMRIMSPYEHCLMWANIVAKGGDNFIRLYCVIKFYTSRKPEPPVGFDHTTPVDWITFENP